MRDKAGKTDDCLCGGHDAGIRLGVYHNRISIFDDLVEIQNPYSQQS